MITNDYKCSRRFMNNLREQETRNKLKLKNLKKINCFFIHSVNIFEFNFIQSIYIVIKVRALQLDLYSGTILLKYILKIK
jgi:hypothetical protein